MDDTVLEPIHRPELERSKKDVEILKEQVATTATLKDLERVKFLDEKIDKLLDLVDDPEKLAKTGTRDLTVAAGILADKKREILTQHVRKNDTNISLRVAWKDGSGAVELKTGE